MSKLLINEPPLQVLPSLAVLLGLNESIVLQQLHYWLEKSKHNYDDRQWVYNTSAEWQEQFPFWSEATIRRTFASLRDKGVVLTGNYNKAGFDRTLWYSIDYEALNNLASPFDEFVTPCDQLDQMEVIKLITPIPKTTQKTTTERVTPPATSAEVSTPPYAFGNTASDWTKRRAKSLKYCEDYQPKEHRATFEAITDAMGKRALVDADHNRTIADLQQAAVTLSKAGIGAEQVTARAQEWQASYFGQRGGSANQFIEFMATQAPTIAPASNGKSANVVSLNTLLENAHE